MKAKGGYVYIVSNRHRTALQLIYMPVLINIKLEKVLIFPKNSIVMTLFIMNFLNP